MEKCKIARMCVRENVRVSKFERATQERARDCQKQERNTFECICVGRVPTAVLCEEDGDVDQ